MSYGELSNKPEEHISLVGFIGTWYMSNIDYKEAPNATEIVFITEDNPNSPILVVNPTAVVEGTFAPPDVEKANPPSWFFEGALSQPTKTEIVGSKVFGILFPPHFAIVGVISEE